MNYKIAVISGDGIGPEIVREARKVLDVTGKKYGFSFDYTDLLMGGASIDVNGVPLTDETRGMISAPQLASMRAGAYVINAARGGIVSEKDLYDALVSGHIAGAAMDVSEVEPMATDNPLLTLDNVIVTPHIGMYSKEAIGAVSLICAQNAAACVEGKPLQFQVV